MASHADEAWKDDASCREIGGDHWFPEGKERAAAAAIRICHDRCPVRLRCLLYSLENGLGHGVWGGVDERLRNRMRRNGRASWPKLDVA